MLNKKEFERRYAEIAGVSLADASKAVDAFLETIQNLVSEEEGFKFVGFFSMEVVKQEQRKGRNPQTGDEIIIPAQKAIKFKAGKPLKDIANS